MPASKDTTKVVLAWPYPEDKPKYQAGEEGELPSAEARRLIADGYARPVNPPKES